MKFATLHAHSEYTLTDGCMSIKNYLDRLEKMGIKAAALTDTHNLFGAFKFHQQAMSRGIKPVIGVDLRVGNGESFAETQHDRMRVLVENKQGYRTLSKILSASYCQGVRGTGAVDINQLAENKEGLFFIGPQQPGSQEKPFRIQGERLKNRIDNCRQLFDERFFVEIPLYKQLSSEHRELLDIADRLSCPAVYTNPAYFPTETDYDVLPLRLAVQTNTKLADLAAIAPHRRRQWVVGPEKILERCGEKTEPMAIAGELARSCYFEFDTSSIRLPVFETEKSSDDKIEELCREGLEEISPAAEKDQVIKRLEEELKVIKKMGFSDYFLIVADIVGEARKQEIMVGPGRGSAAGSLVAYLLGITEIDPFVHDLIFERFLNDQRNEMPDIDLDFADHRRDEVIEYIRKRFGEESVAQIITFGQMKARNSLRAVGRIRGEDSAAIDRFVGFVPENTNEPLRKLKSRLERLDSLIEKNSVYKQWFEQACKLEGFVRNSSTHAAGVLIGAGKLACDLPLYYPDGAEGSAVSQFDMYDIEKLGYLKLDILGLTTLTLLESTINNIAPGERPNLKHLPDKDSETLGLLANRSLEGVFQFETPGNRELVRKMKPQSRSDIIDCIALYRPGPLQSGMVDTYLKRRRGEEEVEYFHPDLKPVLEETYGLIIYQEQVMAIARKIGGFSWSKADLLRKAMGKKKAELMASLRDEFIEGALENGYKRQLAEELFSMLDNFARYGFNRSHSAAYGEITYRTAYLKAHFPAPFYAALCSVKKDNRERIGRIAGEMEEDSVELLSPDINSSSVLFTVENGAVRYGLSAIKHVGESFARQIIKIRENDGLFNSARDFVGRMPPSELRTMCFQALAAAGCFDSLGENRGELIDNAEQLLTRGATKYDEAQSGQEVLFDSGPETDKKKTVSWSSEKLARAQKEALGFFISGHPLQKYSRLFPFTEPGSIASFLNGENEGEEFADHLAAIQLFTVALEKYAGADGTMARFGGFDGEVILPLTEKTYEALPLDKPLLIELQKSNSDHLVIDFVLLPEDINKIGLTVYLTDHQRLDQLQKIKDALYSAPGAQPVRLIYLREDEEVRLEIGTRIETGSSLASRLKSILGPDHLRIFVVNSSKQGDQNR